MYPEVDIHQMMGTNVGKNKYLVRDGAWQSIRLCLR